MTMQYLNKTFSVPGPSKVAPGTCEACVYGRGEHSPDCSADLVRFGRKVGAALGVEVMESPTLPPGTVYFIARREPNEPAEEWLKRCALVNGLATLEPES